MMRTSYYRNQSLYLIPPRQTVFVNVNVRVREEGWGEIIMNTIFSILKNISVAMIFQHVVVHIYMFFYFMWLYYRCRSQSYIFPTPQDSQADDHYYILTKAEFQMIPYRKTRSSEYHERCSICLLNYIRNQRLRVLPCQHVYHTRCIERWLTRLSTECPLCRHDLLDEFPPEKTEINISS